MHESAISSHYQWLPRCRSNIVIGNVIVDSFLLVLNSMALYSIWNTLYNLIFNACICPNFVLFVQIACPVKRRRLRHNVNDVKATTTYVTMTHTEFSARILDTVFFKRFL